MTAEPLGLSELRGCEWPTCQRHRALVSAAELWRVAFPFAVVQVALVALVLLLPRAGQGTTVAVDPSTVRADRDYMAAFVAEVDGAGADIAIKQLPDPAVRRDQPQLTWAVVIFKSGKVDVHGDLETVRREFWVVGEACTDAPRSMVSTQRHLRGLTPFLVGPTFWRTTARQNGRLFAVMELLPWYVAIEVPGHVVVSGDIPRNARAFWQDMADHVPPCEAPPPKLKTRPVPAGTALALVTP